MTIAKQSKWSIPNIVRDFKKYEYIYLLLIPVLAYYLVFCYIPILGVQIAFKDFSLVDGIWGSEWIGLDHFVSFINGAFFSEIILNTLILSVESILITFPMPILFAVMLNEVRHTWFKKTIQTITYMPHFISVVVVVGMLFDFLARDGLINNLLQVVGVKPIAFMSDPKWFRPIYILSDVWQGTGWGSIIYLAAIAGVDQELYEAAKMDGASRLKQIWHVTLPGIVPTIVTLFILRVGKVMSLGYEKVLLMQTPLNLDTSDIISTYVYRRGLQDMAYDFSTAVNLFNSAINFALILITNAISRKVSETSLW